MQENTSLLPGVIRQLLYLILQVLIVVALWQVADIYKSATVQEYGMFETLQSAVLFASAMSFGWQSLHIQKYRSILFCLSMLALAAVVREQDAFMDEIIPVLGWTWCWLLPLAGLVYMIRQRQKTGLALQQFLHSRCFHMMVSAMVIIIPVAQCLGHRSFLVDLLGDDRIDATLVRRIVEEPIELIGYIQILLASVESFFELRQK